MSMRLYKFVGTVGFWCDRLHGIGLALVATATLSTWANAQVPAQPSRGGTPTFSPVASPDETIAVQAALSDPRWGADPEDRRLPKLVYSYVLRGKYAEAVAASELFLRTAGTRHPLACDIAISRADSLAPVSLTSYTLIETPDGITFEPSWAGGRKPPAERLAASAAGYSFAAQIASDRERRALALFKRGWVLRAAGDWQASTQAWDGCADLCPGSPRAMQALWCAAENLDLTGNPVQAAQRLDRLLGEYPEAESVPSARRYRASLLAASRRGAAWKQDPVAAFRRELDEEPAGGRSLFEVYSDGLAWLDRQNAADAALALARVGKDSAEWPTEFRIRASQDFARRVSSDGRLRRNSALLREAADGLHATMQLTQVDDPQRLVIAVHESELRRAAGDPETALLLMDQLEARAAQSEYRIPFAVERIRVLVACNKRTDASAELGRLAAVHPDGAAVTALRRLVDDR